MIYTADRKKTGTKVLAGETELLPARSQKIYNHSPDGFEWGYGGSGPAQLALAILLDVLDDEEMARLWYQSFKWEFVAKFSKEGFSVSSEEIKRWIKKQIKKS